MLNTILPLEANNNYQGAKIAMWFFIVFVCLMTWRSVIHMLFEEYGMHGIANLKVLTGDPDPMPLIYMFFSIWGLAQLLFCAVCWIAIFRYRSLIPLMYLFWILEWGTRTFLYPIMTGDLIAAGEYSNGPTLGHVAAPYVTIILLAMFFLSTRQKNN
jgi:hypothetical protein